MNDCPFDHEACKQQTEKLETQYPSPTQHSVPISRCRAPPDSGRSCAGAAEALPGTHVKMVTTEVVG